MVAQKSARGPTPTVTFRNGIGIKYELDSKGYTLRNKERAKEDLEVRENFIRTGKLPTSLMLKRGMQSLISDPWLLIVRYLPGPIGFKLRQLWYKRVFDSMGKGCVIDVGVAFPSPKNICLSEFVYVDQYCQFISPEGYIRIGKRCHIAQFCVILGHGDVEIEDFVGVASGTKIFSISEWPGNGMRLGGPMIPMGQRGFRKGKVIIEKDAFLGANSVIMPGITIGEGAVIGANSVVLQDVGPWSIVMGNPSRVVGTRDPVTVEDPHLNTHDKKEPNDLEE